jgi:hypothetical protein
MDDRIHDDPGETAAVDGNVALMGPDGVSVVLTPKAAMETSDRLLDSAAEAQNQPVRGQAKNPERYVLRTGLCAPQLCQGPSSGRTRTTGERSSSRLKGTMTRRTGSCNNMSSGR